MPLFRSPVVIRALVLLAATIAVVGAGILLITHPHQKTEVSASTTISEKRAAILASIKGIGGSAAYTQLKKDYKSRPFDEQHNAAHLFGESLYEHEGVGGVSVCDPELNFGCYHGFLSAVIAHEGTEVISRLDDVCAHTSAPSTCQHGIGHGILEYYGHTNLVKALEACRLTNQPDPIAGCTGGVFMEYNVPLTVDERGSFAVAARPLTEDGPYAPCEEMPSEFRTSCFHELPQWWGMVYEQDTQTAAMLCGDLPEGPERNACFHGLAGTIPSRADYRAEEAINLCDLMPSTAERSACLADASWAFVTNALDSKSAQVLCREALPEDQARCPK